MLPEAKNEDLLYVSGRNGKGGDIVYVLSYPAGKQVGELTGLYAPVGLCTDKAGDVWIVNQGNSEAVEYAHGGTTEIGSVTIPGPAGYGCAIDPASGNLAVTYFSDFDGNVAIYKNASGSPVTYNDDYGPPFFFCTYDNQSNLFISDNWVHGSPLLYELPNGSSNLVQISLNKDIGWPSEGPLTIQWTGNALAYGGSPQPPQTRKGPVVIYEVTVSGTEGELTRAIQLATHKPGDTQFWVQGKSVVQATAGRTHIGVWGYPAGGEPTTLFRTPARGTPFPGLAISVAPSGTSTRH
ncbi:MAG TPA: hypothetical protein VGX91_04275 [Candidatus Cybelea sp.]|jgi:hypothetical protein|nr:hypothetical protein [Candidatus Cybelea sp.]